MDNYNYYGSNDWGSYSGNRGGGNHSNRGGSFGDNYGQSYNDHMGGGFNNPMGGCYNDHMRGGYNDNFGRSYNDHINMGGGYNDHMGGTYNEHMGGGYNNPIGGSYNDHMGGSYNDNFGRIYNDHIGGSYNDHFSRSGEDPGEKGKSMGIKSPRQRQTNKSIQRKIKTFAAYDLGFDKKVEVKIKSSTEALRYKELEQCLKDGSIIELKEGRTFSKKKEKNRYQCLHCKTSFINIRKHFNKDSHKDHVKHCLDFKSCINTKIINNFDINSEDKRGNPEWVITEALQRYSSYGQTSESQLLSIGQIKKETKLETDSNVFHQEFIKQDLDLNQIKKDGEKFKQEKDDTVFHQEFIKQDLDLNNIKKDPEELKQEIEEKEGTNHILNIKEENKHSCNPTSESKLLEFNQIKKDPELKDGIKLEEDSEYIRPSEYIEKEVDSTLRKKTYTMTGSFVQSKFLEGELKKALKEGSIIVIKKKTDKKRAKYHCLHCKKRPFFNFEKHVKIRGHFDHVNRCVDFKSCFET